MVCTMELKWNTGAVTVNSTILMNKRAIFIHDSKKKQEYTYGNGDQGAHKVAS